MCNDLRLLQAELCELRKIAHVVEQVLDVDDDDDEHDDEAAVQLNHEEQLDETQHEVPPLQVAAECEPSLEQTTNLAAQEDVRPYHRVQRIVASVAIVGGAAVLVGGITVVSGGTVWLGAATASIAGGVAASGMRVYTRSHSNDSSSVSSTSTASSMSSNR